MSRPFIRLLKFLPLLLLVPILLTAHSTYTFESHLNTLAISLEDFPPDYAEALTVATWTNEQTFPFDYGIFGNGEGTEEIPRIIHFIWFEDLYPSNPHPLPTHASDRCQFFNPTYPQLHWNASHALSFLTHHYPEIIPTYNSYPYPIQKIDLLKYFVLYHYGGVYMDLDVACRRPLEPLLQRGFGAWWPKAQPVGVNNDLMAARKGHPLLKYMTERLPDRKKWLGSEWLTVFWSTGPRFASDMLREWVSLHPAIYRESWGSDPNSFAILPEKFYSQDPGYTFFGHTPGGTWYGDDAHFVIWLLERPWVIVFVVGTPIALWVGLAVRKRRAVAEKIEKF